MINPPTCLFNDRCRKVDAYLNTVGAGLERVSDAREIGEQKALTDLQLFKKLGRSGTPNWFG